MKNKHTGVFPRRLRLLTWINIGVQACFPLAVTFTPAIAAGGFLQAPATPQTKPYTLTIGETPASVAKKFGLSLSDLRALNQFRTFAHGFDHLKPGDELDVPAKPRASGDSKPTALATDNDAQAQRVAGVASQAGSFLANNPNGDAAASMARGMATGAASREVQDWMNQFGTARVQLGADEHFSLKNSQLDLLVPLFEQEDALVFTQGSLHRTDDRTQVNLGVGARWFNEGWMLGGNTFLDHDLSRAHTRMGVGVEYWRDYLKLGANSYLRLSDWKDSPDVDAHEERPANGWDIRAQGWLPALPQVGGKLTYEQYYGDDVALFGKDHRQRDPHAFTAGVEYTPVPLLTFNAEQRQGKDGESDTRFGVDFRYQLGATWEQQVDPGAVQAMRSLAGSRHDLVERNNNIVLEYRKKDEIRLRTAALVTGQAGERKSLGVTVSSNNGVDRIEWTAPALLAAGGKIVEDGALAYSVVLPDYQFTQGVNNYTVSGVAVDKNGNRSGTSETQVSVRAPAINEQTSRFTPLNSTLTADGVSTQVLTLNVNDAQGTPVDVPESEVVLGTNTLKSATVSALVKTSPGVFEVTVTAGRDDETVVLTPSVMGTPLSPARVVISAVPPSETTSTVKTDKDSITGNGTDSMKITFVAKDDNGNPIPGIAGDITFLVVDKDGNPAPTGAVTLSPVTETTPAGTYTTTLTATKAGDYTVIPQYNGTTVGGLKVPINVKADETPDGVQSTFTAPSPQSIAADGTATSTLTFTAKDANGNLISDLTGVTFVLSPASGNMTLSPVTDNADGTYTATLKGTQVGTYTVTPQLGGTAVGSLSDTVTVATVATEVEKIAVNGYQFAVGAGFPKTGFTGAKFTVQLNGGEPTDYTWTSTAAWAPVSTGGEVSFTAKGNSTPVTITATSKLDPTKAFSYSFTLNDWYINNGINRMMWSAANSWCTSNGASLATRLQLGGTATVSDQYNTRGTTGSLWSEWGYLSTGYAGSGFPSSYGTWTSEVGSSGHHYNVYLTTGGVGNYSDSYSNYVACREGL